MRLILAGLLSFGLLVGSTACSSGDGAASKDVEDLISDGHGVADCGSVGCLEDAVEVTGDVAEDGSDIAGDGIDAVDLDLEHPQDGQWTDLTDVAGDATSQSDATEDVGADDEVVEEPPAPVLNEIGCFGEDYIELFNRSHDLSADISGYVLADGEGQSHTYVIPFGTVIPPLGRLLVVEKSTVTQGFPFGLQGGEDTVSLMDPDGVLLDSATLPLLMKGNSYSRLPDGLGLWAESSSTPGASNQPKEDLEGILFNPGQVISMAIELPEASIVALWTTPDEYAPGTFSVTSGSFQQSQMPIGVRLKGGTGSFQPLDGKPSLKLKFNFSLDEQRLLGLKKLTLNNMVQDPSMLREVVSYRLFREFGVPAPRTGYAVLTLNGDPYGVYLVLEAYDDVSLSRYFSSILHLYEGDSGVDVVPSQVSQFEVDEGNVSSTSDLAMLAIVAQNSSDDAWLGAMGDVADMQEFLRMWAVEHLVGHWDGYSASVNNYYLHSTDDKVFSMLPSGTDEAFTQSLDYHQGAGVLFNRCMGIEECRNQYDAVLAELSVLLSQGSLWTLVGELSQLLAPWIEADPRQPFSAEEVEIAVISLATFLEQRVSELELLMGDGASP